MAVTDLALNGRCLQSALIEYTLRMQLSDVYFIFIESPFTVDSHGEILWLSTEEDVDEAFQPIRQLVGQTVKEVTADETGALRICFSGGARIHVPPDEAYEAWSVSGPDGTLVVCTPGGKLAIWSESSES
jgi:hypothetical protein